MTTGRPPASRASAAASAPAALARRRAPEGRSGGSRRGRPTWNTTWASAASRSQAPTLARSVWSGSAPASATARAAGRERAVASTRVPPPRSRAIKACPMRPLPPVTRAALMGGSARSARHGGEDRDLLALGHRGLDPVAEAHILAGDEHVHEPPQGAVLHHPVAEPGVLGVELVDQLADGARGALHGGGAAGDGAQRGRDADGHGHGGLLAWWGRSGDEAGLPHRLLEARDGRRDVEALDARGHRVERLEPVPGDVEHN